ncbi:MAG: aldo/keto reductase [Bacilli bacterium]|nr:aldo/keto reductase [Bacilli bacterium]
MNRVLNNGIEIPEFGIGTYLINSEDAENSVREALKMGYRLVDTANLYKNERAVGRAIKASGVDRKEIFVSSKVWINEYNNEHIIDDMLERLGLDYIDLVFIHEPIGNYLKAYKTLEKAYKEGKIRAIGVSNFFTKPFLKLMEKVEITPQVAQVERHPLYVKEALEEDAAFRKYNLQIMSWFPLCRCNKKIMKSDTILNLSQKYNKTPCQIVLRWHIQKGYIPIPGSKNVDHIKENIDIFNFELTKEEIESIDNLDRNIRYERLTIFSRIVCRLMHPKYDK